MGLGNYSVGLGNQVLGDEGSGFARLVGLGDQVSQTKLSSPREARAFNELRRYHTRPLQLNWGPENVHFRKT